MRSLSDWRFFSHVKLSVEWRYIGDWEIETGKMRLSNDIWFMAWWWSCYCYISTCTCPLYQLYCKEVHLSPFLHLSSLLLLATTSPPMAFALLRNPSWQQLVVGELRWGKLLLSSATPTLPLTFTSKKSAMWNQKHVLNPPLPRPKGTSTVLSLLASAVPWHKPSLQWVEWTPVLLSAERCSQKPKHPDDIQELKQAAKTSLTKSKSTKQGEGRICGFIGHINCNLRYYSLFNTWTLVDRSGRAVNREGLFQLTVGLLFREGEWCSLYTNTCSGQQTSGDVFNL